MNGIIFTIISVFFVSLVILLQTKRLKRNHPAGELLIKFLQILGIQMSTSAVQGIHIMEKISALLLCRHNSGRSQMAEAFFNEFAGHEIHAESAGLEPKDLNPLVIEVMQEAGYDISKNQANSVSTYFTEGRLYNYVIT